MDRAFYEYIAPAKSSQSDIAKLGIGLCSFGVPKIKLNNWW